jgi:ATP-dependent RNA helicase RhlE
VPSTTFSTFNLDPQILANIQALEYKTPTPIQKESIPPIMLSKDFIGLAQTGTGKTAAFLLPLIHRLIPGPRGHVRALILAPTRELAQQIHEAFGLFAKELKLRSVALYGGMSISPQKDKLRRGAEVVIACPGRLLDHVRQRSVNLSKVEILVLDEADHMFDVGFLPDIRQIMQQLPKKRQTLLFSATMPSEVRQLAHDILQDPVKVQINNTAPVKAITQALYPVSQNLKTDLLIKLLQTLHIYSALVFTRTKHRAKRVSEQLEAAGYTTTSLQGNLSQSKRQAALRDFRNGKLQILVATDIASRGIDVASISHVFNYDMPDTVEAYTHRIGRTGRAAKTGDAFTLLAREDSSKLRTLERALGIKIEQRILPDFDYKAQGQAGSMRDETPNRSGKRSFGNDRGDRDRPSADSRPRRPFSGNKRPSGDRFDQGERTAPRRPSSDNKRPSGDRFGQGERAASSGGRARSFSQQPGAGERDTGYSRSRSPAAEQRQYDKPAGRSRSPHSFGDRAPSDRSDRPASRGRPPHSFSDRPQSDRSDRPAGRNRAGNSFDDRAQGGRGRTADSFGNRSQSDRADRPAGRGRAASSFSDRSHSDRADRPAGRSRAPSSFNDRPQSDRGDRPFRSRSAHSPSDRSESNRAPSRRTPSASADYGQRPPSRKPRNTASDRSDRPNSTRAAKAPFKPGAKSAHQKPAARKSKPRRTED